MIIYSLLLGSPISVGFYILFFKNLQYPGIIWYFLLTGIVDATMGFLINNISIKLFPNTEISFGYNRVSVIRKYAWQFIITIIIPFIFMIISLVLSKYNN